MTFHDMIIYTKRTLDFAIKLQELCVEYIYTHHKLWLAIWNITSFISWLFSDSECNEFN